MGLCDEQTKERLAQNKPKGYLLLEYISTQIESVRKNQEMILALSNGYPYYTDFSAITPHPDLTDSAVISYCDQHNAALMQVEKRTPLLLFGTYHGLRAYIHQGKELQIKNPIRKALSLSNPTELRVGIAPQQTIGAIVAKAAEKQTGSHNANSNSSSDDIWYAFQSPSQTVKRFARLMDEGINAGATDIAIVPIKKAGEGSNILLRQYGAMRRSATLPYMNQQETTEVVRFLLTRSGANPEGGALREPRDGQLTYISSQGEAYVRCSYIPAIRMSKSMEMEPVSVSLRLLPRNLVKQRNLEDLNLHPQSIESMVHATQYSQGLIILAGPTNSGKSTTIAGMMAKHNEIYGDQKKRLSIEDPVEQYLPGITQFQVPPFMREDGFALIMRAILRHDPDVVWIGEIRDPATARTAVRAASSGHLVLTTVHANDCLMAWKVIENMIDKTDRMNLIESLSLISAQRLVRTACPDCSTLREPSKNETTMFEYYCQQKESSCTSGLPQKVVAINNEGCSNCSEGFAGVNPINEILPISRDIKDILHENQGSLHNTVASKRKLTLMENSLHLMKQGLIDVQSALV